MTKILITGGTGFVGRRLIPELLAHNYGVYSLERLSGPENGPVAGHLGAQNGVQRVYHDLRAEVPLSVLNRVQDADFVVHLAADVSGIKSLSDPELSVVTNVVGTSNILELCRKLKNLKRFIFVSSAEVLGPVPFPFKLDESKPLRPTSPYAASKAGAEALVNAYRISFGVPTLVVRSANLFGPGQGDVRFIPTVVRKLLTGDLIKCHVDTKGQCGSRNWLHVNRFNNILDWLFENGKVGETYHVVGPERTNLEVITALAKAINKPPFIENVPAGATHDLRYALEDTKLCNDFDLSSGLDVDLAATAVWYNNQSRTRT
jgi:dTDP-glucose 4,6-dehydratase